MMVTETTVQCRYEFEGPGTVLKNATEPANKNWPHKGKRRARVSY